MITAVSSTTAVVPITTAARPLADDANKSADAQVSAGTAVGQIGSAVVTISPEAAIQAQAANQSAGPAVPQQSDATLSAITAVTTPATGAGQVVVSSASGTSPVPAKPDWTYLPADANKDGKVTVFEQQAYDFKHYPSAKEKAEAYSKSV